MRHTIGTDTGAYAFRLRLLNPEVGRLDEIQRFYDDAIRIIYAGTTLVRDEALKDNPARTEISIAIYYDGMSTPALRACVYNGLTDEVKFQFIERELRRNTETKKNTLRCEIHVSDWDDPSQWERVTDSIVNFMTREDPLLSTIANMLTCNEDTKGDTPSRYTIFY